MKTRLQSRIFRGLQLALVASAIFVTLGATDSNTRFERLGHQMMCQCGCSQVLLECNHVGCTTSEKMRAELTALLTGGDNSSDGGTNSGGSTSGGTGGGTDRGSKAAGSDEAILQKFVAKYGPVVLAAPTQSGFNRVAWIMPYLVLVLGIAAAVVVIRTWKRRRAPVPITGVQQADSSTMSEYRRRVHQETEL